MMKAAIPPHLPINQVLPDLLACLSQKSNAVLVAPPGAGKTTSVPLALLDADWLASKKIIMLAPRRLAARAAAARMASLLNERVGERVGYRVRLDSKISQKTRIEVVTEGIFIRMILADADLSSVGAVIFDEVHERNLEGDLALALALDCQAGLREDLRLIAMSATLDGARIARLLGVSNVIESQGAMFRVETRYVGNAPHVAPEIHAADVALRALNDDMGDVLAFLPGVGEINRAMGHLSSKGRGDVHLVALHGAIEPHEQDAALAPAPHGKRKIVFASSIAETSLTIQGVRIVVDCGLTRRPAYDAASGFTRLVTVRASRAACDQRRGRAGRTATGVCYRLWEEAQTGALPAFDRPEILEADLAPLMLTLAAWGVNDPADLIWLDPPPLPAVSEGRALLRDVKAIDDDGRITPHGHVLASFGLPPRLAHMITSAAERGFGKTAAYVAAILSERGLGGVSVDIKTRVEAFAHDRSPRGKKARDQATRWATQVDAKEGLDLAYVGQCLALAFPERVAKARDRQGGYLMRGGRGGEIDALEPLSCAPFLAIGALQGSAAKGRILEAASLSKEDVFTLFGDAITHQTSTQFDRTTGRILGRKQTCLGALVLEDVPTKLSSEDIRLGLYQAVSKHGLSILSWDEKSTHLRDRLAWLHRQSPEVWPDVSDEALLLRAQDWLFPALDTVTSLQALDVAEALLTQFDWSTRQSLDSQAPALFLTPAQTRHKIEYAPEQGPTVEVRVQELFGLAQHPKLAGGQVPIVFQLLSPAHRPVAMTADLPGFWRGAWVDVRKDMKARYPRHFWPDDPASATPTTRAKPRGT